jgi:Peptidase family M48
MWRFIMVMVLVGLVLSAAGCAEGLTSSAQIRPVEGAPDPGPRIERLRTALGAVDASQFQLVVEPGLRPQAHGWKDGRIAVSMGLLQLLDDDELAAALAHEIGHLIADGRVQTQFGLDGCRRDPDAECAADAIGSRLLLASGIPADAMVGMLAKVRDAQALGSPCRTAMSRRIARLQEAMQDAKVRIPSPQ